MKLNRRSVLAVAMGSVGSALFGQQVQLAAQKTHLKEGDLAPDFTLPGTNNSTFKLSEHKGKQNVVLAFFPAAFTGGCTTELTAYQAGIGKFKAVETQVVAISTDFVATLNHWSKELGAEFPILSDHNREVCKLYGVLNEKNGVANRTTFVVDADGRIVSITTNNDAIDVSGALAACARTPMKK